MNKDFWIRIEEGGVDYMADDFEESGSSSGADDTNPDHNDKENSGKRVDEVGMDYSDGGLSDGAPSQTEDSNEEVAEAKERFEF